jgi:hypothetical protein
MNANGRLNVTEIVFESTLDNLVVPITLFRIAVPRVVADTVQTQDTHLFEQRFLMGGHHPTLSGCQLPRRIEAEDYSIAESPARVPCTDREPPVVSANSVGCVLHNGQTPLSERELHYQNGKESYDKLGDSWNCGSVSRCLAAEFENTDWSSPKTAARSLIGDSPDLV